MILSPMINFLVPMIALAILSVPGSMLFKWIEHPDSTQSQLQLDVKPEVYDACATEDSTTSLVSFVSLQSFDHLIDLYKSNHKSSRNGPVNQPHDSQPMSLML